ncbi:DNA polymerase III subunit delta' [Bartonella sp. F02]|uniref:DNA polymerase III subunit delta' n=1 Tax=Bartonella sp. F02 TaxID=2967262 RepID=UPI0022A9F1E7|nr:DNA polymerase III subunit delta' [Bartonella sp. F02]MCZ2328265.1 DNA polymerase III subunit delta' [Bartonella sp. F02]
MSDVAVPCQYDDIEGVLSPSQNNIIIGHEKVRHFLAQMCREERLHHALLFEGERGIGKTTLAFHLAWNLLTNQKSEFLQPDSNSLIWHQIMQGCHPNVLHVSRCFDLKTKKFKTSITIDEIRNITHFLNQTSRDGGWRIVIIDSADDMNKNAANAILKTLEEPPKKTLFIIITHCSRKILPTIRSRCQQVFLQPLCNNEMRQAISHVFSNNLLMDEKTIESIIQKSHGSLRKTALLICYDGLEIIQTIEKLLEQKVYNPAIVQSFAQKLSSFDTNIQFQQFCDEILNIIQKKAVVLAENGNLILSKKYAQIWQDINKEISEIQLFNLDKRQFIINLLFKVHKYIHK